MPVHPLGRDGAAILARGPGSLRPRRSSRRPRRLYRRARNRPGADLHRLFARRGLTIACSLRETRAQRCRAASTTATPQHSVGGIPSRSSFDNPAYFSRRRRRAAASDACVITRLASRAPATARSTTADLLRRPGIECASIPHSAPFKPPERTTEIVVGPANFFANTTQHSPGQHSPGQHGGTTPAHDTTTSHAGIGDICVSDIIHASNCNFSPDAAPKQLPLRPTIDDTKATVDHDARARPAPGRSNPLDITVGLWLNNPPDGSGRNTPRSARQPRKGLSEIARGPAHPTGLNASGM